MLPAEALEALNQLPCREALQRPLIPENTGARRAARLLADDGGASSMTVGDALFRWARVEPEALAEADVARCRQMSDVLAAVGHIPKRFHFAVEATRSGASVAAAMLNAESFTESNPAVAGARSYLLQRMLAHLFEAQGSEAAICGAEADPTAILLNGLQAVVHDPQNGLPTKIDRLTFLTQEVLDRVNGLANNPLVLTLMSIDPGTLDSLLPARDVIGDALDTGLQICLYANSAAQAGRILLKRDTGALLQLASLASGSVAGHLGHIAGKAAAVALLGVTGSWMVVLAPVASGFAGRVLAKSLLRRARYELFCRHEGVALNDAVRLHCVASRDALQANMTTADRQGLHFREIHATASGPVQDGVADWLDRLQQLQDFRQLNVDRFHRASIEPSILDPHGGDPVAAAQESLLSCARVELHPANVAMTSEGIVAASRSLHQKMKLAII